LLVSRQTIFCRESQIGDNTVVSVTPEAECLYADRLEGGSHWSLVMRRGTRLRLVDIEGGANLGMLLYNPLDKLERYNAPDTLKCQHTFRLGQGNCLFSDMGRIFCSLISDDLSGHDTVCGNLSERALHEKYEVRTFQEARNERSVSGEYAFLIELGKHGLGERDLAANVNFFSKVLTDEAGNLSYVTDYSGPGSAVELRFEMDSLVIMHSCPHPLNPSPEYPRRPVAFEVLRADPPSKDDPCLNHCEENRRGFQNNAIYHLQGGY